MKLLLFLLIAGYTKASSLYDEAENIGFVQAIAVHELAFVTHKCPNATRQNLKEEERKAIECIKNIRYNSSFCNTFVHHFKPCVQTILTEAAKCDENSVTEMKHTVLDSVIAIAGYVCETDGEHILEILNPCVSMSIEKSEECRKKALEPLNNYSRDITQYCSKYTDLRTCFNDQVHQECQNEITKSSMSDLFSVDIKPCNIVMEFFFQLRKYVH
ncbi:uncharacterized protein LOC123679641 isoform X2 [Harmonia axyridis]|uniref:uncharacterized protein LOC123679641 isoform X2 n=1 Tax=Harmonia axyridis TaxID=115357 RepID=UPI001E27557C|nr:uncharacterized protein LOC123679641 isoform X2 [Harmonia axyridis]